MTVMKLYRLLQVFLAGINDIVQGLHNETISADEGMTRVDDLLDKLKADMTE